MELLRDIWSYLLGERASSVTRPVWLAVAGAGSAAAALILALMLGGAPSPAPPVADAVVSDRPMTPVMTKIETPQVSATMIAGSALIRSLQTGLQKAGCYDGPASGYWTQASKNAMAQFNAVTNAKLPVEKPDQVLLAQLSTNPAASCKPVQPAAAAREETAVALPVRRPTPPPVETETAPSPAPLPQPIRAATAAAGAPGNERTLMPPIEKVEPERAAQEMPPERDVQAQPRRHRRHKTEKTETAFNGVSKQIGRNFKSLQRSLASIFK